MKKRKLSVLVSLLLVVLPSVAYAYYSYALDLSNSSDETAIDFVVESGQGVEEIANTLERKGLIRSAALFQLYTALSKLSSRLQAGEYQIPQNLNLKEVVEVLQHGTFEEKITFIEGWRREEFAEAISAKFNPEAEQVRYGASVQSSKLTGAEFLRETEGLEGYLFPDTYFVSTETTAEELVRMMRENFGNKIKRDTIELKGITFEELVIIASMVEREGAAVEDKPVVAGVLFNRLLNNWPLQVDATVQYALGYQEEGCKSPEALCEGGWWKKSVTFEDLEVDSPYNTYKNPGLPPAPICNPGLASLEAAFNPAETDYWYYVSDSEGRMHFAETIEQHNENVAKYVR